MSVIRSRFARLVASTLVFGSALGVATLKSAVQVMAAEPWPSQVQALYRVEFNGFDIGSFEFNSSVNGTGYTLSGDARLSALLGAFHWTGATRSSGALSGDAPRPAGYSFDFTSTTKSGNIKMGFASDSVAAVSLVPPMPPLPGTVPVRDNHLKGVLDPLSAVMAISRADSANPCGRRLAIFDGKQRFDLLLSFRRQERVAEARPSGQPGIAFVCRVKYLPVAGHRATEETRSLAASNDIEISLRPVPSANLFIPHEISIPTGAGTVKLVAQQVRIVTRSEQIALGH